MATPLSVLPADSSVTAGPASSPAPSAAPRWPAWQRFLFRYAALHWLLYAFPQPLSDLLGTVHRGLQAVVKTWPTACGDLGIDLAASPWRWPGKWAGELGDVQAIPVFQHGEVVGGRGWWQLATSWFSDHDLVPFGWRVIHQITGSGDTAHAWMRVFLVVAAALVLATLWTVLSRAGSYPRLGRWLHLAVRWFVALAMIRYGLAKFCGGQFGELELTRLVQPIGDTSPMGMVGTGQKASRAYELFGGGAELLGGLLLIHRRTALLGAMVSIGVMTNVCALNWLCGVPVKQFSAHLLLFTVGLLAPFAAGLWAMFVRNRPSRPVDLAVVRSPWLGVPLLLVGVLWAVGAVWFGGFDRQMRHDANQQGREKGPLYGVWLVDRMLLDGVEVPVSDASRWQWLAIDRGRSAWAQPAYGERIDFEFGLDAAAGTASVRRAGAGDGAPATWSYTEGRTTQLVTPPEPERRQDLRSKVPADRRTLVWRGEFAGRRLELHTTEKRFRLQEPFRLRQELPAGW